MPGPVKQTRKITHKSFLKGFTGRQFVKSAVLLASSLLPGGTNEKQTVTITGTPAGGTFTLTYSGQTTAAIAFDATAAAVEDALEALSTIGNGDVDVTGGPGPGTPYVVEFTGDLGRQNIAAMTASGALLTGGTTPAVAVTTPTGGDATNAARLIFGDGKGVILTKVPGNVSKVKKFEALGGEAIIGIGGGTDIELFDRSSASDIDIPNYNFGAVFDKTKILDYATHEAALITWAAANACKFE